MKQRSRLTTQKKQERMLKLTEKKYNQTIQKSLKIKCPIHNRILKQSGWWWVCPVDKKRYTKHYDGSLTEINPRKYI